MNVEALFRTRVERLTRARDVTGIVRILADPHEAAHERAGAASALIELREELGEARPAGVRALLEVADQPGVFVRWQALLALAELRVREAMPVFRRAARDREWLVRVFAAHGFDRLGDAVAFGDAVRLLEDRESQVREAAASALGAMRDQRALPLLERAARADAMRSVREAAAAALDALGR